MHNVMHKEVTFRLSQAWVFMGMDTAAPISSIVQKVLRWIEWILLADCIISNLLSPEFESIRWGRPQLFLLVAAVGTLSLRLPIGWHHWQRQTFVAAEFLLLFTLGFRLDSSMLFELFIIKACLLLPRRDAIVVATVATGLLLLQNAWYLPTALEAVQVQGVDFHPDSQKILLTSSITIVTVSIFVVLMGCVLASEQRDRRRAEMLAIEVESLATQLERSRIARNIHDSLGHSLTTLDIQLALAERYSQTSQAEGSQTADNYHKLQQTLSKAKRLTAQCLAETRQSLHTMRKSNFDLPTALQTLSEQMRQSFRVNLQVQLPLLPQQLSYQLYLIAKEGLVNVQKHAKATQVTLTIAIVDDQIVLRLIDDGGGFDLEGEMTGYGLQGIRERSHLLGGYMTISSSQQQGTHLQVVVPIKRADGGSAGSFAASIQRPYD